MAATPSYQGVTQPTAGNNNGWLQRVGSVFGGRAEIKYAGAGQPVLGGSASSPAYASAPVAVASATAPACDPSCPVDPQALAQGYAAIVIPQQC